MDRLSLGLDKEDPYISLHFIMIFVRDQERSLHFYLNQLGFRLIVDEPIAGFRWIEVAPPDGSANLALVQAAPESVAELVGRDTRVYLITEDVQAKYEEWNSRGVRFDSPPRQPQWGGIFTRFEAPDGNSFGLAGFLFGATVKLLKVGPAVEGFVQHGFSEHIVIPIGLIELTCAVI